MMIPEVMLIAATMALPLPQPMGEMMGEMMIGVMMVKGGECMESEHEEDDPVVEPEEVPMTAPPVKTPAPVVEPPEETPVGKATVEPVNKIPAVAPKPMQDYLEPYCNTTICVNIASYIISFRTRSLWGYHFVGGINASFDIKQPCQHQRVEARSGFQSDQCFFSPTIFNSYMFHLFDFHSTAQDRT